MFVTDLISITELSRLTKKSRPTIYKYINDYNRGKLDEIPYSIIELFKMSSNASKSEIKEYCYKMYGFDEDEYSDPDIEEIKKILVENKSKLNFGKIKDFIMEELKNDK